MGGDGFLGTVAALFVSPLLFAAVGAGSPAFAQDREELEDPYTENDPEAMKAAGYVRYAPFLFASQHTTEVVEETLGGVPLIWVETEHFKIGSSLEPIPLSTERDDRKRILADIKRLKKLLPDVKAKPKKLDRWLRLHLYAMRLEELYDSFGKAFDLPIPAPSGPAEAGARTSGGVEVPDPNAPLGSGAFRGMRSKFAVLLLEKGSSMSRYTSTFCAQPIETAYRYHFSDSDTFFFGLSAGSLHGTYATDTGFHYGLIFGLIQNFSDGYGGFSHNGPLWWTLGLARWFARRFDDRFLLYTAPPDAVLRRTDADRKWGSKVRGRVDHEFFPSTDEMLEWAVYEELEFAEHMILWSRVDYVMSLEDGRPRAFLDALAQPIGWQTGGTPREELIAAQHRGAFRGALGIDTTEFDQAWARYVTKNYPKR